MEEALHLGHAQRSTRSRVAIKRRAAAAAVYAAVALNAGAIVWLWIRDGNLHPASTGELLTSIGRITGLLAAYLALLQVLLLARLPALERAVGFDRLSVWHRWNGHVCIDLVVAHVVFTVWGYALMAWTARLRGYEALTLLPDGRSLRTPDFPACFERA
jgi:predicted ferric reductase